MIRLHESFASGLPEQIFSPGELVHHKRYDYRGVVVEYNPTCQADEAWYKGNKTQPDRNQPWYHVLVHGGQQVTYVAQVNLEPDNISDPVSHPLVDVFFSGFENGVYIRNDRPWPEG